MILIFDLSSLTLKTFSEMPTRMKNMCARCNRNPFTM